MKRKLTRRHKARMSRLICCARANAVPVSAFVDLLRRRAEDRQKQHEARRYGVTMSWDKAEKDSEMFLTVPEITGKGTVTGYRTFFSQSMMPEDKRTLWDML